MLCIGLIRERKTHPDERVAFTPKQCALVQSRFPGVKMVVESSATRCFTDAEYAEAGIPVVNSVEDCDVLLGIKEVPAEYLIPGKTYFFFSHTKKKQPYNQDMMHALIK